MRCTQCGSKLLENAKACSNCGFPIEKGPVASTDCAQLNNEQAEQLCATRPKAPGTKWLKFWNYFILPVGGVLGLVDSLHMPAIGIVMVPMALLLLAVAYGLHKRRIWGWKWNWVLVVAIWIILVLPSNVAGPPSVSQFLIPLILAGLVWMWPNYVYWKKRRALFAYPHHLATARRGARASDSAFFETSCHRAPLLGHVADRQEAAMSHEEGEGDPPTKRCPFCGETILAVAVKCKHCGEYLHDEALRKSPVSRSVRKSLLSSLGLGAVVLAVYVFSGIGAEMKVQCEINGLGIGSCEFTNDGWSPGKLCARVALRNMYKDEVASSSIICSGRLWAGSSSNRKVYVNMDYCSSSGSMAWTDVCAMKIYTGSKD